MAINIPVLWAVLFAGPLPWVQQTLTQRLAAQQDYEEGMAAIKRARFKAALVAFSNVIRRAPDWDRGYYGRGMAWAHTGAWQQAIEDFTTGLRLKPNCPELYLERARAYGGVNLKRAFQDVEKTMALEGHSSRALTIRGMLFMFAKQLDKAVVDLNDALDDSPQNVVALCTRATVFNRQGRKAKALGDLNEAVRIAPKDYNALWLRGDLLWVLGKNEQALVDLNQAIATGFNDGAAHVSRAILYGKLGKREQSIADCTEALRLSPKLDLAHFQRGHMYLEKGEYDSAVADFTNYIALKPGSRIGYLWRACVSRRQGKEREAVADEAQAKVLPP